LEKFKKGGLNSKGTMKEFDKCKGCDQAKMLNRLGLCKRCNKNALDLLSPEELAKIKAQQAEEHAAIAARKAKEAEKAAEKAAAGSAEGESAEGEKKEEDGEKKEESSSEGEKPSE